MFRLRGRTLQDDSGAGLCVRPLSQNDQGTSNTISSLAKTKPGRKRNAIRVLWCDVAEIKHYRGEASSLQKQIRRT